MIKKIIFSAILACLVIFNTQAQDQETSNDDFNKWQVRLRAITVVPNESATIEVIGGDVAIDNAFVPELDFTYFFTKNIAAELILGTAQHDVQAISTAAGDIELGDVRLLPPTLTLQYHPIVDQGVRPYVGLGINYTLFYDVNSGPVADEVEYDSSIGYAVQLGFDFDITDKWFINLDAKYLMLSTDVTVNATTALGATVGAEVDINPFIAGIGIGMKF